LFHFAVKLIDDDDKHYYYAILHERTPRRRLPCERTLQTFSSHRPSRLKHQTERYMPTVCLCLSVRTYEWLCNVGRPLWSSITQPQCLFNDSFSEDSLDKYTAISTLRIVCSTQCMFLCDRRCGIHGRLTTKVTYKTHFKTLITIIII